MHTAPAAARTLPRLRLPAVPETALWTALVALTVGALYGTSLLPGTGYGGDTAKFQFIGWTLGTPHPPGYPTYVLLNAAWVRLVPVGSLAWRANLLSAVCAVAAVAVLVAVQRRLGVRGPVAALAALVFGVTYTLWSQATVAEVYALHVLVVALVVGLVGEWLRTGRVGALLAGCAVYAVGFGNHLTLVTLLPALGWAVAAGDWRRAVTVRHAAWVAAWIAIGAAQYGYLVWRTYDPPVGLLEVQVHNLREFWDVVTGGPFRGQMFAFGPEELPGRARLFLALFRRDFKFLVPVVALGILVFRPWRLNVFLLLVAVGNGFYALNYDIPDIEFYLLPSYLVAAVYLGVAMDWLVTRAARVRPALAVAAVLPFAAVLGIIYAANKPELDRSNQTQDARRIEANLAYADRDAYILANDYHDWMYYWYYLYGEGWYRRNITVDMWLFSGLDRAESYLRQGTGLPPGISVYCEGWDVCTALGARGYRLVETGTGLLRVLPPAAGGP